MKSMRPPFYDLFLQGGMALSPPPPDPLLFCTTETACKKYSLVSSGLAALSCGSNLTCTLGNTSLSACFMVAVVTVPGVLPGVVARMIVGCRSIVCPARVVVTVTVCIWSVAALISSMSSCFMNV